MKGHKAKTTKSSTLLTTELRKQGLKMVQDEMDPALGLGPMFTITALKQGTSNSDVAYRLYYAGEVCKVSAKHRNAVAKAKKKQSGNGALGLSLIAAGGVKNGSKLELVVDEASDHSSGSETGSDSSSDTSGSSVSGVND
ncbi:hypothetical protein LTR84_001879 [Exophiala bonariae]|uniref:Uncharacterized protein n=1 Tax=Exophiala bonariae TaxID=1690606 RepID=A0AAV9NGC4_9EURO|nr:hypothetical protein LTR84_001879 [Exophiala bonariae]